MSSFGNKQPGFWENHFYPPGSLNRHIVDWVKESWSGDFSGLKKAAGWAKPAAIAALRVLGAGLSGIANIAIASAIFLGTMTMAIARKAPLTFVLVAGALGGYLIGSASEDKPQNPASTYQPAAVKTPASPPPLPKKIYLPELRNIPEVRDAENYWPNGHNTDGKPNVTMPDGTVPNTYVVITRKNGPTVITTGEVDIPGCKIPKGIIFHVNTIGYEGDIKARNMVSMLADSPEGVCPGQKLRLVILPLNKIEVASSGTEPAAEVQPVRKNNVQMTYTVNMKGPRPA